MKEVIKGLLIYKEALTIPQIRKKLAFTFLFLFIFRLIAHIPVPGVDLAVLRSFFVNNQFLALLDIFSGGTLINFSIGALGLGPYIVASVMLQLLGFVFPRLGELRKEGEYGRQKITQYSRLLTIPIAFLQAIGMYFLLRQQKIITTFNPLFLLAFGITMVAGTVVLMFLGELINQYGIGNGISLIIFAGIVARYPISFFQTLTIASQERVFNLVAFGVMAVLVVAGIIFIDEAVFRVPIRYAKRGGRFLSGERSYLPLKINTAGVMPIIFALSLVMFPQMIANFMTQLPGRWSSMGQFLANFLTPGGFFYNLFYFFLVVIFTYFYTTVVFNPQEVAEELRKGGAFIPGVRPGKATEERLNFLLGRVTVAGAFFLGIVAILPAIVQRITGISTISLGGTGILIVVSVILEVNRLLENLVQTWRYQSYF